MLIDTAHLAPAVKTFLVDWIQLIFRSWLVISYVQFIILSSPSRLLHIYLYANKIHRSHCIE